MTKAVAYMRTSSAAGVGDGKDSEPRQRAAITAFAAEAGYTIAEHDFFYDPAVKGKDAITTRPGFSAMLQRIQGNGVRTIIVESPDRFARDLLVQLTGHDYLKAHGIALVPASAPDYFLQETPTAVLIRQVLGAVAEFDKASHVARMRIGRDRKRAATGKKVGGRKSYAEINPEMVVRAKALAFGRSLREIAAILTDEGFLSESGTPFSAMSVSRMISGVQA